MKVYEFGAKHRKTMVMFQCTAEPWWAFKDSAEAMAMTYHVFLMIADGHDEIGTDFISLEKYASDAASYLRKKNVPCVDMMYGVSMGGGCVVRFLAAEDIPVDKAIIDAGITPYPYSGWICRLIAFKDFITVLIGTRSYRAMKLVYPQDRWTPKGEDPEEHYRKLHHFYKQHFSPRTIYNVFWSANNYSMPDHTPAVDTKIEYWYGEEEKKARKNNLAYVTKTYPQAVQREFKGLAHAELVLMFPERIFQEVTRFQKEG